MSRGGGFHNTRHPFATACLFEAALALPAFVLSLLIGLPFLSDCSLDLQTALLGISASLPLLVGFLYLLRARFQPLQRIREALTHFITQFFLETPVWGLLLISSLAGFSEEWLFRGTIQRWLGQLTHPFIGLALSSLLFGLCHFVTFTYALIATGIGLYLGALYLHFGNLAVPMVTHAFYDFVALLILQRTLKSRSRTESDTPE